MLKQQIMTSVTTPSLLINQTNRTEHYENERIETIKSSKTKEKGGGSKVLKSMLEEEQVSLRKERSADI